MKTLSYLLLLLLISSFSLTSCEDKSYYKTYTRINGKYIKNYLENKKFEDNRPYFHKKYGIIKYQDDFWRDQNNAIIYELGQR